MTNMSTEQYIENFVGSIDQPQRLTGHKRLTALVRPSVSPSDL